MIGVVVTVFARGKGDSSSSSSSSVLVGVETKGIVSNTTVLAFVGRPGSNIIANRSDKSNRLVDYYTLSNENSIGQ